MKISLIAASVAVLVAGSAHADLIVNGGFETGNFDGWTVNDPSAFTFVTAGDGVDYVPNTGTYFALLGAYGVVGTISQTFADVAGATYDVSFYLASDGEFPNSFGVTGPGPLFIAPSYVPDSPYTEYFGTFAGSGSDTIIFSEESDNGFLSLDDVSVTLAAAPAPEPAAWATMLLGLGVAGAALRRRKALAGA